jgi:type VI secretion system protein ImpM
MMRRGLFGKLQARRDFVAPGATREFLAAWEPWLQSGVAASRFALGESWRDVFLTAPIWRFWLGRDICGATALGLVMPSMDGVGRYFPLTLVFIAENGEAPPPPEIDPLDDWFALAEAFLLSTLDAGVPFEHSLAQLQALPEPPVAIGETQGFCVAPAQADNFAASFSAARRQCAAEIQSSASFWWTSGGEGYAPLTLTARGLPHAQLFAGMLSGSFGPSAANMEG